jgi:hypothetical protein
MTLCSAPKSSAKHAGKKGINAGENMCQLAGVKVRQMTPQEAPDRGPSYGAVHVSGISLADRH